MGAPKKTVTKAPEYIQPHLERQAAAAGNIYDRVSGAAGASGGGNWLTSGDFGTSLSAAGGVTGLHGFGSQSNNDADNVYQGGRVAGFSPDQIQAMSNISGQTSAARDLRTQAQGIGSRLSGQGYTQGQQRAGDVYGQYANNGLDTRQQQAGDFYSTQATQGNEAFKAMLDAESRTMRDEINRNVGGAGRSFSGVHQNMLTRDVGDARNKALANNFFNTQAMQQSAADRMASLGQQNISNRMGAAGAGAQLGQQGFNNQQTSLGLNRQAQSDLSQQYGRQLAMGGMQQSLEQARLNANQQKFAQEQEAPWADLSRYTRATNPLNSGGTTTQYAGGGGIDGALSGAASGAAMGSIFGPWGTLVGAGLGGLTGVFSDYG